MLANIEEESGFYSDVIGDYGTSGGLFQHHDDRFSGLSNYSPGWKKDWKSQIDYALQEPLTSTYLNTNFSDPQDASEWFTINWENPSYSRQKAQERKLNVFKYNY